MINYLDGKYAVHGSSVECDTLLVVLTWVGGKPASDLLLFLFIVDNQKMCSWVHSATVLAGRLPLKIHLKHVIAEVSASDVEELMWAAGHCNVTSHKMSANIGARHFNFATVSYDYNWMILSDADHLLSLYQASFRNSPIVRPWSLHKCHRITEVITSIYLYLLDLSTTFDTITRFHHGL